MDEASRMRGESIRKALDYPIRQQLVSPLHVELEPDNYEVHFRTDLVCQMCIAEYPNNALLLEECFKCAIGVDPQDVEALGLSADFFWQVRNDH
ncbi:hypothetical protein V6Z11_A06G192700 [Gossypium hirsutum]|uniref:Uncharacterized protein isoform X2 n=1 Tax=Gossypium hirsutum TaxID=3635 RepID=A0A1U8PWC3_GOSHI|nr:uncharacterized protein LOC107963452 isoform X2 [Gossypium hirsutum]